MIDRRIKRRRGGRPEAQRGVGQLPAAPSSRRRARAHWRARREPPASPRGAAEGRGRTDAERRRTGGAVCTGALAGTAGCGRADGGAGWARCRPQSGARRAPASAAGRRWLVAATCGAGAAAAVGGRSAASDGERAAADSPTTAGPRSEQRHRRAEARRGFGAAAQGIGAVAGLGAVAGQRLGRLLLVGGRGWWPGRAGRLARSGVVPAAWSERGRRGLVGGNWLVGRVIAAVAEKPRGIEIGDAWNRREAPTARPRIRCNWRQCATEDLVMRSVPGQKASWSARLDTPTCAQAQRFPYTAPGLWFQARAPLNP